MGVTHKKNLSKQFIENNNLTEIGCSSADQKFKTTAFESQNLRKSVDSMSFSVRHSHCHDLLMGKAKKLSLVERGQIVELHKQGLLQRAIAAKVGRSKTFWISWKILRVMEQKSQVVDPKKFPRHWAAGSYWLSFKTRDNPHPKLKVLLVPTAAQ